MSTWQDLKNNPRLKNIYDTRLAIIRAVREFFWSQNFVEAATPIAVRFASQEPYLNPFTVTIKHPSGQEYPFFLHTSPEYALKKLLAVGYQNLFEITQCFRNVEDFGGTHNPEFTMLEWYRSPGKLSDIMDDTEKLFRFVLKKISKAQLEYQGKKIVVNESWERLTMKEVWQKYLGVNLDEYLELATMQNLAAERGYTVATNDAYEDLFFKLFLNEIEPKLGLTKPIFVYEYPARMCSLSRISDRDARYAERFELYIGGLEVANAFGELTNAIKQEKNLEEDKKLRLDLGKSTWPVDPDFISALKSGISKEKGGLVSGIALGLDRMVVLCTGAKDVNEVIFDSIKDQIT